MLHYLNKKSKSINIMIKYSKFNFRSQIIIKIKVYKANNKF